MFEPKSLGPRFRGDDDQKHVALAGAAGAASFSRCSSQSRWVPAFAGMTIKARGSCRSGGSRELFPMLEPKSLGPRFRGDDDFPTS